MARRPTSMSSSSIARGSEGTNRLAWCLPLPMRLTGLTLLCLVASVLTIRAADVAGIWTGEMQEQLADGQVGRQELVFKLQQSGDQVAGSAGPGENAQRPIRDAKFQGVRLTFAVTAPGESGARPGVTWKFDLTVAEGRLEG